jgi:hypothetical protein
MTGTNPLTEWAANESAGILHQLGGQAGKGKDMPHSLFGDFGEAPAVRDLPIPDADGAFLILVRYAGVNPG